MKRFAIYFLLFVITTLAACSTKKNTWAHRNYHNITSYYNIYFNGKEAYKKGSAQIKNAYRDDFTKLIPIYKFGTKEASQTGQGEMDRAIKKCSKLIKQHSIKVKPNLPKKGMTKKQRDFYKQTEYNKWVDDAYLLIGKSYYQQLDLNKAARSFQLVLRKFPNSEVESLANLWLWRTYVEAGDYVQAERYMLLCKKNIKLRKDHNFELAAFEAEFYLRQKMFAEARTPLRTALRYAEKKQTRLRIRYIMAQTYIEQGEYRKASPIFSEIAKKSNDYDMAFNAKLQQATAFDNGNGNYQDLIKSLEELTTDEKNSDYLDRIYLAMAGVAKKASRNEEAKDYYQKCLQAKGEDTNVKAEAYLALADMEFENKQYKTAGAFYDSTMINLSKKHENYTQISVKAKTLGKLGKNLETIQLEDSLQTLAKMPEKERDAQIERAIAAVKQKEAQEQQSRMPNNANYDPSQNTVASNTAQGGEWYFYNPSSLSFGQSEFKRKWGERRMADHWRRSNKTILESANTDDENEDENTAETAVNDPKKKEYYLQNLPKTKEDFAASDTKIQNALLATGNAYKSELQDLNEASKAYQELANRYPKSDMALEALYNLYLMHRQAGNTQQTNSYKQQIIRDFPNSSKAKALRDPAYAKRLANGRKITETAYQNAFSSYHKQEPELALKTIEQSLHEFPNSHLADKFALLKAMCYGKLKQIEKYKKELNFVLTTYPKSTVIPLAKDMLSVAEKGKVGGKRITQNIYKFAPESKHYVVVGAKNRKTENRLKFLLVNFNVDFSRALSLETKIDKIGTVQVLKTTGFTNLTLAKQYWSKLMQKEEFKAERANTNVFFIISESNYSRLQKDQDIDHYLNFFEQAY